MVLCVTHSNDVYNSNLVISHLQKKGIEFIRFNTDQLLIDSIITHKITEKGMDVLLAIDGKSISYKSIKAVWFRKLWNPSIIESIDESYQDNVVAEIRSSLFSYFHQLEASAFCLNKISVELEVERNKFRQLQFAKESDLLIPDTIVTTDYAQLSAFYAKNNENIIAKLQNSLSFSIQNQGRFFPTTEINDSNIKMLEETIRICPMIFQANIAKAYELRIAYVNGICLTGKINATKTEKGKTDWRNSEQEAAHWEKYELPEKIVKKLKKLMDKIGLSFGVIDMIVTPKGEYVFLEINPSGEWGMLEKDLDLPISETIANTIAEKI